MPGSSRCGGYTPSGWSKLLKKCQEITSDCCTPCPFTCSIKPCVSLRYSCLPKPSCQPCPHLCPIRSLPRHLRPYTPCCPMYFPSSICCSSPATACIPTHAEKSQVSYKSHSSGAPCNKVAAITAAPYTPMYMNMPSTATKNDCPRTSSSAPGTLP
ncbi:hypothetical protein PoB_001886500 [Plakobranchus ocellatus]|uniref:Epidermal differentiation protein n=1 Tax=Plakobranchus ocellatus TaxID=259542 RepID=A0AAV3ZA07_9GAST|nr:hypothetical protein PoB_001886500 [Plakobranchus ocellatus]